MQQYFRSFRVNAAIEYDSKYSKGFFGDNENVFPNLVLAPMYPYAIENFQCKACNKLHQKSGLKIVQIISKLDMGFMSVKDIMYWCEVSLLYLQTLINFTCSKNTHTRASGLDLKKTSRLRSSTTIAPRTYQKALQFMKRRGLLQFLVYLYRSLFLYLNSIKVVSRTVWWYCFYRFL